MDKLLKILMVCKDWGYSQLFTKILQCKWPNSIIRISANAKPLKEIPDKSEYSQVIMDLDDSLPVDVTGILSDKKVWLLTSNKPASDDGSKTTSSPVIQRPRSISEIRQFIETNI